MGFFDSRFKFRAHILQIVLVVSAIGVTVARMLIKSNVATPKGRANTMALGVGAKSLIIIGYELVSEHTAKFRKWHSLKANMILNILETVFWAAVIFMTVQAIFQNVCSGITCYLSWGVAALGVQLSFLAGYTAVISTLDFRYFKSTGKYRGSEIVSKSERIEDGRSRGFGQA